MDASNRLKWILYGFCISIRELDAEELIKVIRHCIARTKNLLKYVKDFAPASEILNCGINGDGKRVTILDIVKFPANFPSGIKTKIALLSDVEKAETDSTRIVKAFYIAENGELVEFSAVYNLSKGNTQWSINETAISTSFVILSDDNLKERVYQSHIHKGDWWKILRSTPERIASFLGRTIEEREEYLRNMRSAKAELDGIIGRSPNDRY